VGDTRKVGNREQERPAAAEIDLEGVGHTVILRCRIVFFCKTGWGRVVRRRSRRRLPEWLKEFERKGGERSSGTAVQRMGAKRGMDAGSVKTEWEGAVQFPIRQPSARNSVNCKQPGSKYALGCYHPMERLRLDLISCIDERAGWLRIL